MSQREELEERIRVLTQTIERMNQRLAALEGAEGSTDGEGSKSSRRGFLRLGAAAAIGAVGMAATRVIPAAAADGSSVTTGATTTGETPTYVQDDSAGGTAVPVLGAKAKNYDQTGQNNAGTFEGSLQGLGGSGGTGNSAVAVDGVDGWASGDAAFGVYGLTDSGFGVVGESNTGVGLYARRSGRIQQDPLTAAGQPTQAAGPYEIVRDAAGVMWLSGPNGLWMRAGINPFPNPRRIVGQAMTYNNTYGPFDATTRVGGGGPSGVPAGAAAAWCAVQSYSPGVLTLFPDGTADTHTANYSGTGTAGSGLNMLYMLVPLSSAGKFRIHSYITGNVYVDVWGFLY